MMINGMEPRTGDVVLDARRIPPGLLMWREVWDESHITHFLWWRDVPVAWGPVTATRR